MKQHLLKTVVGSVLLLTLVLPAGGCADKAARQKKAEAFLALCQEHYDERDYPAALKACHESLDIVADARAYTTIGLIYSAQRRYSEAIEYHRKALKKDPELTSARVNLGVAYYSIGRNDEAIDQWNKALEDDFYRSPDLVQMNLCEAHLKKKLLSTALDHCNRAIERNRALCPAHWTRGRVYREMGQYRSAIDAFSRALEECPKWQEPRLDRAEVRIKLKQFPQACDDLREVMAADRDEPLAYKARRYMERLKCAPPKEKPVEEKKVPVNPKDPRQAPQQLDYRR